MFAAVLGPFSTPVDAARSILAPTTSTHALRPVPATAAVPFAQHAQNAWGAHADAHYEASAFVARCCAGSSTLRNSFLFSARAMVGTL